MSENTISIGREGNGSEIDLEDIPDDWELPEVGDVSEVNSNPKSDETDVPYLPMDALDTEMPSPKYTERRNPKENSGTMFRQYDTLFAKITPSTENGKSAYIDEIDTSVGIATTEVITLSPEETHPLYLYYYANSHPSKEYAVSRMRGTSGRQRVPKSVFERELKIPLSNFQEQRRIASVLYSVDEQIRTLTDRHDSLTQLKHGLMQDLLTGETRVTPEMAVRQDILTENKESSVREDEKWEEHRYEEVGDIIGGGTPDTSKDDYWGGKVQWAVPSEVTDRPEVELEDTERKLTEEGLNNTSAKVLPETSVLMTSRATVGVPVINCVPMSTNQGFQSFDVSESDIVNPYYLYYQIEENADYIDSIANGGTFDEISKSELAKLRVNIPPLWEQERIASLLYTVDEMIARTSDLIDEYERLKRGLMQDLLSGDVRTPEDLSVLDEIKLDADSAGADGSSVTQSTLDV